MKKMIYLDNAATTKTASEVVEAMLPYFTEKYGNPSSVYSFASGNKEAISEQRDVIAEALGAQANEIYFTAGGSESDNWALKAAAEAYGDKGNHIITTKIEHHAILHTAEYLEKRGFEVTYLDVDEDGKVSLEDLKKAIRPSTILISVMYANNEIGTIQPIREIGEIAHENGILFHTDAVQAFGQVPIQVDECHIDRILIYPQGRQDPFFRAWRSAGEKAPRRYGECPGDHRAWNGGSARGGYDGRTGEEGEPSEGSYDLPDHGRDPILPSERA